MPPRLVGAFFGFGAYGYGIRRDLAGEICAAEFASLVGEGVAVVFIEGAAAVFAGVDLYFQRAGWFFLGGLHDRLHRNDGAGANVEWEFV